MAHVSGQFDGGTTRAKLSTILSYTRQDFFEVEVVADQDNAGEVYLGPVTVTNAGVDAVMKLKGGNYKRFGPYSFGAFRMNLENLYVVGSAASQVAYVNAITADGRRIPLQM